MTAGLGIYDTMQYIRPPVATWCVGQASSMASLLLCSGTPGMRHSLPNSRIMIHQPSGQASVSFMCDCVAAGVLWPYVCNACVLWLCVVAVDVNQQTLYTVYMRHRCVHNGLF